MSVGYSPNCDLCLCPDMIRRRSLRTRAIKMLVLDEADEMLNKGRSKREHHIHGSMRSADHLPCDV